MYIHVCLHGLISMALQTGNTYYQFILYIINVTGGFGKMNILHKSYFQFSTSITTTKNIMAYRYETFRSDKRIAGLQSLQFYIYPSYIRNFMSPQS